MQLSKAERLGALSIYIRQNIIHKRKDCRLIWFHIMTQHRH